MTVNIDTGKIQDKIDDRLDFTQELLDMQVAKDSNYYCPEDVGTLQDSVLLYSKFGSGVLSWDMPYANDQYYKYPTKSKDKNPNARMKWFEEAKARKCGEWEMVANAGYNK